MSYSLRRAVSHGLLLLAATLFPALLPAQGEQAPAAPEPASVPAWFAMMQDPRVNFFDTRDSFEAYWNRHTYTRGEAYKVFRRWEHYWESRVNADGSFPGSRHVLDEWSRFNSLTAGSKTLSVSGQWTELGPVALPANGTTQPNGLGRINAIAFHPLSASTIYIGAPSGGLWRTTNSGSTWQILTDTLPTLGVSSILVHPVAPDTIYIGSGDRDAGDAPGMGVLKSDDGGQEWYFANTGMGNVTVGRMIFHPADARTILAATSGGIFKTANSGASWSLVSSNTSNYKDIVAKPGSSDTVYATANGAFYRSLDFGSSWTQVSSGLPSLGRMVIGVSADEPLYVYCLIANGNVFGGLYRSTNGGTSFSLRSSTPNILGYEANGSDNEGQATYDLCIAVDPNNAETVFAGGINIWKSVNGGSSWSCVAHWVGDGGADDIHADQHDLVWSPHNGYLYSGNDGGIYYTPNGGSAWTDISSGLAIAQVYKIGQSAISRDLVINGYQDNGTAIFNGSWSTEIGGDGMECIADPGNVNRLYGALYFGDVRRSTNGGLSFTRIAAYGYKGITESGAWVTPYILDEGDNGTMYIGYKNLWRSTNVDAANTNSISWSRISYSLGGSNSYTLRVLEQSTADHQVFYMSRSDGRLFRTDNLSASSPSWTDLSTSLPTGGTFATDLECHPLYADVVFMTKGNGVYMSGDKGQTWTDITGSLPDISMNCLVFDSSAAWTLFVGTDAGVYVKTDSLGDWAAFSDGLPVSAEVTELEIWHHPSDRGESVIRAATYGRGLWSSPLTISGLLENEWTGLTDTDWGNPANWTIGVPGEALPAYVPGDPQSNPDRWPVVSLPSSCSHLLADSAARITIGDTLMVTGSVDIHPDAVLIPGTAPVLAFRGGAVEQPFDWGSARRELSLVIDKVSGTVACGDDTLSLGGGILVRRGSFDLGGAMLDLGKGLRCEEGIILNQSGVRFSGTDTASYFAMMRVEEPDTLQYSDFENLGSGWTIVAGGGSNSTWAYYDLGTASGTPSANWAAGIYYETACHDDWLISPQSPPIGPETELCFYARSNDASWPEDFDVWISTTGSSVASFTVLAESITAHPASWVKHCYRLADLPGVTAGDQVYLGIQALSCDEWYLFIDDVSLVDQHERDTCYTWEKLIIDKPSSMLTLERPLNIADSLLLLNGIMGSSDTSTLFLLHAAYSDMGSDSSFVDGPVGRYGQDDFVFPTGDSPTWAPIGIDGLQQADTATLFTARYTHHAFSDTSTLESAWDALGGRVSRVSYWTLDRTYDLNQDVSAHVSLHVEDAYLQGVVDTSELVMAHWDGSEWELQASSMQGTSIRTDAALTSFSPFALGSEHGVNPMTSMICLPLRAYLGGPYDALSGKMRDDLRQAGLIPSSEPYSGLPRFSHAHQGGGEVLDQALFGWAGDSALIDWVLVGLRPAGDASLLQATRAGLLRADGLLVDTNGSCLSFRDVPYDSFYVSLEHRNHTGVMTAIPIYLHSRTGTIGIADPAFPLYGSYAGRVLNGVRVLWPGATSDTDANVIYSGPGNDATPILDLILADPGNTSGLPNYISIGYSTRDVNLDGNIIYSGPSNDPLLILDAVLAHPANSGSLPNFIISSQLP